MAAAPEANVFVCNRLPPALLPGAGRLMVVQVAGAGVEGVDLEALADRGVLVGNSHSNAPAVAEHAVALLMALTRDLVRADRFARSGSQGSNGGAGRMLSPGSLRGSAIGFLGFGHVAQEAARLLAPFGSRFLACTRGGVVGAPAGISVEAAGFEQLFRNSDAVIVTVPLTNKTRGLVDKKALRLMKSDALLVNVSRGGVLNQRDLYDALAARTIAAAALDSWVDSNDGPGPGTTTTEKSLLSLENVLLSPHIAAHVRGAATHLQGVVDNLVTFARRGVLLHAVDPVKEY